MSACAARIASLHPFFKPRSVAVVGASRDPAHIGARLLDALIRCGFQGPIYPINPRATVLGGLPAYRSIRDVPGAVDLAIVVVPCAAVLQVVDDCAHKHVPALLVISSGFAEVGGTGTQLQNELRERARRGGMRLIGPNCLGLIVTDPQVKLNASFAPLFAPCGNVAMSSDSGALGLAILAGAARLGLGLSSCVSVGNRADVSSNDLLEYWGEDPATEVILLYLESFGNPRRFAHIARSVSRRKPIIAVKAGRTAAGRRAASSHTAALAARDVAIDALFHQTGVIRADTLEELFDLAAALSSQPLPAGRRVAIVSNGGGPGTLCADACEASGLAVPELSEPVRQQLAAFLPLEASVANPIDLIASATSEQFRRAIDIVLSSNEVHALIAIYVAAGGPGSDAFLRAIGEAAFTHACDPAAKPVLVCLMPESWTRTVSLSTTERIPCYAFPEAAARVLGKMADLAEWRARPEGHLPDFRDIDVAVARKLCARAVAGRGAGWLTTEETRQLLQTFGLPVAPGGVARSAEEAAALAATLGFPVAVKLASHQLVHKTEIGGVCLNLPNEEAVRQAFATIQGNLARAGQLEALEGVLVQPMLTGGTEVMAGMTEDPLFGPLLVFGLGGIYVEILGDVCFRVAPLTDRDAGDMVRSIRGFRLLRGYRGHPAADVPALEDVLLRVSRLVAEVPQISELDLNPIFALPPGQGCRIVDARIRVRPAPKTDDNR